MTNYIFLGPPGSGKGTQAKILSEKIDAYYFGMGDEMRAEAKSGSELGRKFQAIWDQGQGSLIPPELVSDFFSQKVKTLPRDKQIIFDGYPRNLGQAQGFDAILPDQELMVINIEVNESDLVQRMSTRKVCSKCSKVFFRADLSGLTRCDVCSGDLIQRQEDKAEIIEKRISVYNAETKPLIDYFREKGVLVNIDGNPPIDEVEKEIWEKIHVS
jgi:adenylate kinase